MEKWVIRQSRGSFSIGDDLKRKLLVNANADSFESKRLDDYKATNC